MGAPARCVVELRRGLIKGLRAGAPAEEVKAPRHSLHSQVTRDMLVQLPAGNNVVSRITSPESERARYTDETPAPWAY